MGYSATPIKPLRMLRFFIPARTVFTQAIDTYGKKTF